MRLASTPGAFGPSAELWISAFFVWTLTGTNTGPGGTGNPVRVNGIEVWKMGESGLIGSSQGDYDADTHEHQLAYGFGATE